MGGVGATISWSDHCTVIKLKKNDVVATTKTSITQEDETMEVTLKAEEDAQLIEEPAEEDQSIEVPL